MRDFKPQIQEAQPVQIRETERKQFQADSTLRAEADAGFIP